MKQFNQMTENQMSLINGGLIGLLAGLFGGLATTVTIGVTAEAVKRK